MTLIAFAGAVWAFCFLATAIAEEKAQAEPAYDRR
jgi:hypothetical protein